MELFIPIIVIFGAALLAPFLEKWLKGTVGWVLAIFPLASFFHYLTLSLIIGGGETITTQASWIPALGIHFTFYLDGLSLLFILLITGIGSLVLVYSGYYMKHYGLSDRFYMYLMVFMGAMMGLVLTGNLVTMFLFWELTSVSSFMLIGFFHEKDESRFASQQALLITTLGGLALLSGIVLINQVTGTFEITNLLNNPEIIRDNPLYLAILLLIAAGAFTKSAQFPFHFWLPGAMAGPSPVSAFLHSATMVKAGVYLLMRLSPVLGGTPEWKLLLTVAGVTTMFVGAYLALTQTDLKRILAYTTISALGTLILLTGINTVESIKAAIIFLVVHSLYKGSLFMVAGSIDKKAGTRDLNQLGGLSKTMPFTTAVALVALFSMAGLPPFIGFIGKELIYEAKDAIPDAANFLLIMGILSNALLVAISGIFAWRVFFGKAGSMPLQPKETPVNLWLGPAVLAVFSLVLAIFPNFFANNIAGPAVRAIMAEDVDLKLSLWHGFNMVLLYSLITVIAGVLLFIFSARIVPVLIRLNSIIIRFRFTEVYGSFIYSFLSFTKKKTRIVQSGKQRLYLIVIFLASSLLVWFMILKSEFWLLDYDFEPLSYYGVGVFAIMVAATIITVFTRSRITAIISMGVVGFGVALVFLFYSAPDLAITQILVDTLIVILFVMVIYHLPKFKVFSNKSARIRDGVIALVFGGFMTGLALMSNQMNLFPTISSYFNENSLTIAKGRNVVNVILVDFRAFDTLGEITVLAIAAIAVYSLISMKFKDKKGVSQK
ncbi:MAG: putative monovalent cation/H+ antiporter subunit A [Bacteroidales bacterium]|nr:putative monovalent cation/H+ antiporter subunit A [Bacteroidales bacterium]